MSISPSCYQWSPITICLDQQGATMSNQRKIVHGSSFQNQNNSTHEKTTPSWCFTGVVSPTKIRTATSMKNPPRMKSGTARMCGGVKILSSFSQVTSSSSLLCFLFDSSAHHDLKNSLAHVPPDSIIHSIFHDVQFFRCPCESSPHG